MVIALTIFVSLLMPLYAVYQAWTAGKSGRLVWLLRMAAAVGFMGFLTLVARWDFLSVYLVWLWRTLIVAVGTYALLRVVRRPWVKGDKRSVLWTAGIEFVIGLALFGYAGVGLLHPAAVDLRFPFAGGSYVVGQGGSATVINYHSANDTQRFALDILALDELGRRADGIEPTELASYRIYGREVVSPCDGEVTAAVDGIADNAIGSTNRDAVAGNHVVIACEGIEILLAHFMPGSVLVKAGDSVATGEPLGRVGNSGNSSEPHLHIHAVRTGTGGALEGEAVPLTFGGRFLVRGSIIGS